METASMMFHHSRPFLKNSTPFFITLTSRNHHASSTPSFHSHQWRRLISFPVFQEDRLLLPFKAKYTIAFGHLIETLLSTGFFTTVL
jgi:hypothetical protein